MTQETPYNQDDLQLPMVQSYHYPDDAKLGNAAFALGIGFATFINTRNTVTYSAIENAASHIQKYQLQEEKAFTDSVKIKGASTFYSNCQTYGQHLDEIKTTKYIDRHPTMFMIEAGVAMYVSNAGGFVAGTLAAGMAFVALQKMVKGYRA